MKKLEKKDLVYRNVINNKVEYGLTPFGKLIANCLAKLPTTPKEFQDNKTMIRWFYVK